MEANETALISEFSSLGAFIKCLILFVLAALDKMFLISRIRQKWHLDILRLTESSLKWMAVCLSISMSSKP